mmetsp:Transcript_32797/g.86200  ORF Transcript_32797/g.86200 Transcript_32797/m.86200 type:complete len:276 (-) Transcript_32797:1640-2467(-)
MVRQVAVRAALEIVVVGVLREPAVHEGPREVVDGVLLRLDRLRDRFGAHVVGEIVVEVRLDWQRLVQKLAVEGLLRGVAEEHAAADVVEERPACAAQHLEQVGQRVVNVPVLGAVVALCVHDDHQVRLQRERPAERVQDDEDLHRSRGVQRLDGGELLGREALVHEAKPVAQRVRERRVLDLGEERRDIGRLGVEEAARLAVGRGVREQIDGRELRLLGSGHVNDARPVGSVVDDRVVRRLRHREQPRRRVRHIEPLNVQLERHGAHVRVKVEER